MDIEEALEHVGSFGRFQLMTTTISFLSNILFGSQMVLMVIVGATPDMSVPSEQNLTTIVTEWDLYDSQWIVDLMSSLFMTGYIVGCLTLSQLADLYGRKPIVLANLTIMTISCLCSSFCNEWKTFAATRFLAGLFAGGSASALFAWVCELLDKRRWGLIGMLFQVFFSFGIMFLAGTAYLTRNWRHVCLIVSALPAIIIPIFIFFVPESPRWLYSVGKFDRANDVLIYIAKVNKRVYQGVGSDDVFSSNDNSVKSQTLHKYSLIDMFRVKYLAVRIVFFCVLWFSASIVYYGLTMDTATLMPNIYLGLILSSVVELPAYAIVIFTMEWRFLGRRGTNIMLMLVSALACSGIIITGNKNSDIVTNVRTALGLISKLCVAGSFSMLYVYNSEMFPTQLRVAAISAPNVFARVGAIIAPFVPLLATNGASYTPFIVFGVASWLGAFANLFLPETLGQPIPQMPAELTKLHVNVDCNSTGDGQEEPLLSE